MRGEWTRALKPRTARLAMVVILSARCRTVILSEAKDLLSEKCRSLAALGM